MSEDYERCRVTAGKLYQKAMIVLESGAVGRAKDLLKVALVYDSTLTDARKVLEELEFKNQ